MKCPFAAMLLLQRPSTLRYNTLIDVPRAPRDLSPWQSVTWPTQSHTMKERCYLMLCCQERSSVNSHVTGQVIKWSVFSLLPFLFSGLVPNFNCYSFSRILHHPHAFLSTVNLQPCGSAAVYESCFSSWAESPVSQIHCVGGCLMGVWDGMGEVCHLAFPVEVSRYCLPVPAWD